MGVSVVVILTGGAVLILRAYQALQADHALEILTMIRQQAAVVATLAISVFLLLDALERGKVALGAIGGGGFSFQKPAGVAQQAIAGVASMQA